MANTLSTLIGPLYETLDTVSREFVGFIPGVTRDNGNFARAAIGQVVTSFTTPTVAASDVVPGVTAPNDGDQVFGQVNLTISKSRRVPVRWNGEETMALNNSGPGQRPILMQQMMQAFRALTNEVESDLSSVATKAASRAAGTAGTTPFGIASDLSDFAQTAKILDVNGAPLGQRQMVLNSNSMANLRGKQSVLFRVNEAGTEELLRNGIIGRVEGFDLHYSTGIKAVTKGSGTGYVTTATLPVGSTAIPLGSGTGTVNIGDVVTFAGDSNQYAVIGGGGTAASSITLSSPGLLLALASGSAMTIGASYTPNVAFTSDALLLATRMPAKPVDLDGTPGDMADDSIMIVDPFSGLAFEISVYKQYRQIHFEVALAWGVAAIKSEHIALLLG